MPEKIRKLSLGEILTIPIDFTVTKLCTEDGYVQRDVVRLENEDLGIVIDLSDAAYGLLAMGINNFMEDYDEKGTIEDFDE